MENKTAKHKNSKKRKVAGGINWSQKLTSKKFWMSIATFISMMTVFFGGNQDRATQITALIMAGGASVAYIVGEGFADAASAMNTDNETEE